MIVKRLRNALASGGVLEVIRKAFYNCIYIIAGRITQKIVEHKPYQFGLNTAERSEHIVVSLTSFPPRFSQLDKCLKSLIVQSVKPDRIIVYLGSDSRVEILTEEMKRYEEYGVEYRFDSTKNLMPHKKYFYAMQEFPDSIVVTADDDVIYPNNWLKSLYYSYKVFPEAVSARRVHFIKIKDGELLPYDHWKDQCRDLLIPSMRLIATGNGGVLYPPGCFDKEAFNYSVIEELCLRTDDIWLKCMEIRNRIPVVWVKNWQVRPATVDSKDNQRLQDENVFTGNNDIVLNKIMCYYSLSVKDLV